jgi:hypothetical protein
MLSSPVYAKLHPRQPIPHARLSSISFRRSQRSNVQTFQPFNDPRPNAIQPPSKDCHPKPLPSRQHLAPLSPLPATLMDHPASVANKRLTENLTPLDATLTKNRGEGCTLSFTPFHQIPAAPVFSFTYKLPIFYPLCFDIHPCNGGWYPPRPTLELRTSGPTSHKSPITSHQSPITSHQSPTTSHRSFPFLAARREASYTLEHPDETMRTLP